MKYISIDIETTGLNPKLCQIIEIGAVVEDTKKQIPIEYLPSFHCYIKHEQGFYGEPYALNMNRSTIDFIQNNPDEAIEQTRFIGLFAAFLARNKIQNPITVAGKNFMGFDYQFLKRIPNFTNFIHIRHRVIDPAILCANKDDEALPDLLICKQRMGISGEVKHTALEDAKDVVRVLRKSWHSMYQKDKT